MKYLKLFEDYGFDLRQSIRDYLLETVDSNLDSYLKDCPFGKEIVILSDHDLVGLADNYYDDERSPIEIEYDEIQNMFIDVVQELREMASDRILGMLKNDIDLYSKWKDDIPKDVKIPNYISRSDRAGLLDLKN